MFAERAQASAKAALEPEREAIFQAAVAAAFYQRLANDGRDPEYLGSAVTPGDSAAVLLSWQLEDGQHRVIYGDLHAETVASLPDR